LDVEIFYFKLSVLDVERMHAYCYCFFIVNNSSGKTRFSKSSKII
jgi:hypothetical protein